jgi:polyisoprenoid-binding protein YceI
LESIVAGTIRKGSFGIDWGPWLITKQFTSTHIGFEHTQYVEKGPRPQTRLESIVAGTIRKGPFGIDWGPG